MDISVWATSCAVYPQKYCLTWACLGLTSPTIQPSGIIRAANKFGTIAPVVKHCGDFVHWLMDFATRATSGKPISPPGGTFGLVTVRWRCSFHHHLAFSDVQYSVVINHAVGFKLPMPVLSDWPERP